LSYIFYWRVNFIIQTPTNIRISTTNQNKMLIVAVGDM